MYLAAPVVPEVVANRSGFSAVSTLGSPAVIRSIQGASVS
jgi:hypothetical protein